jgi:hypothetical protein
VTATAAVEAPKREAEESESERRRREKEEELENGVDELLELDTPAKASLASPRQHPCAIPSTTIVAAINTSSKRNTNTTLLQTWSPHSSPSPSSQRHAPTPTLLSYCSLPSSLAHTLPPTCPTSAHRHMLADYSVVPSHSAQGSSTRRSKRPGGRHAARRLSNSTQLASPLRQHLIHWGDERRKSR